MYEFNRHNKKPEYSDHIIFSPNVVVFRDDISNKLLEEPYTCSFLTCAAVNVRFYISHMGNDQSVRTNIRSIMTTRAEYVLMIAAKANIGTVNLVLYEYIEVLVLGAWGCGVFGNSPTDIAGIFHNLLNMYILQYTERSETMMRSINSLSSCNIVRWFSEWGFVNQENRTTQTSLEYLLKISGEETIVS